MVRCLFHVKHVACRTALVKKVMCCRRVRVKHGKQLQI